YEQFLGEVNVHVFEDWCGETVDQLRKDQLFPLFPHSRTTINRLAVYPKWENYGLRIFGYLHPGENGEYIFAISSDGNSEFWLSENESPEGLKLLAFIGKTGTEWTAPGEYEKFASQTTQPVHLERREQYYFEIIYKQSKGMDHMEVAWRLNSEDSSFEVITAAYLSLYIDDSSSMEMDTDTISQTLATQFLSPDPFLKPEVDMVNEDPRDVIYKIPLLNDSELQDVVPSCAYRPIYIFDNATIVRYEGINHVRYSTIYPNDHTRLSDEDMQGQLCFYKNDERGGFDSYLKIEGEPEGKTKVIEGEEPKKNPKWNQVFNVNPVDFNSKQNDFCVNTCKKAGNIIMQKKDAMIIVDAFMRHLQSKPNNDLVLKRVLNVEKKYNDTEGTRYLIELEMENREGKSVLMSKYLYSGAMKNGDPLVLCNAKGFAWNPEVTVHVILAVKNQGRWVKYFIKELENVYKVTGDKNFNIIIVDFNSHDINIEKELKIAKLPSYQFKKLDGRFAKAQGIQVGVDLVRDDNSILFMVDLHIHFPPVLIQNVRKHCVQGKMVFAPVVMRLDCGATLEAPKGFWETDGYGLVGIYKSDMDRIGGMNTAEFTDKWGGEDWELLDRIILNKLEVERLNIRNFAHFYHSKRGMWNKT
ncbi:beta-1,4-N-acetylgalactosaminyltransferase 3-like, partial [Trichomycterus rosablanca]|uniref:beta-1,4-N-acetylgalactosaminyltransferase 3-like n=1 Tax=Trichomycterus rosablanca TaxID=2290929 RepID=UPI002F35DC1C